MTTNVLRDVISDLILDHVTINIDRGSVYVSNSDALAELILARIQETHSISERSPASDHPSNSSAVNASWAGQVDRQGGSFSDQEIADSYTWR